MKCPVTEPGRLSAALQRHVIIMHFNIVLLQMPKLGRPRRRGEDNIKMDLREIGWGGMDCIDLAQDGDHWRALVNTVMNLRVP
jgi:hypothetical protein